MKQINFDLFHLEMYSGLELLYLKMQIGQSTRKVYSEYSLAKSSDKRSELELLIFVSDEQHKCHPIHYDWYNFK